MHKYSYLSCLKRKKFADRPRCQCVSGRRRRVILAKPPIVRRGSFQSSVLVHGVGALPLQCPPELV